MRFTFLLTAAAAEMQLVDLGPLFGEGGHGQLMMGPHVAVGQGRRGLPTASIGDAPFPMMTASIGDAPFPADDMPGLGDLMEMMTSMRMAPPPMMRRRRQRKWIIRRRWTPPTRVP